MQDQHVVILVGPRFCYFHKGILCEESVRKISCIGKVHHSRMLLPRSRGCLRR